jgi:hypothetical protein
MAEPKRGSVAAFKAAEERRKARIQKASAPKSNARKEAFNKKVASINKSRTDQGSVSKFKAAEERRQQRLAKVNQPKYGSPKMKKQRAMADVEKDLPKSKVTGTAVASAMGKDRVANRATKVADAGKTAKPIAAPKAEASTPKKSADLSGFGAAFKKARAQGVGTKFAYNDKQYAAVTKDDISRAGKSSLKEFLESSKRKATTKLAKAPGQREEAIVRKAKGGTITPSRRQRLKEMMQKQKEKNLSRREELKKILPRLSGTVESMNTPGMRSDRIRQQMKDRSDAARDENIRLKERSEPIKAERRINTLRSMAEQMQKSPAEDRFKSGGSVMARGCKMGRKKATKLY